MKRQFFFLTVVASLFFCGCSKSNNNTAKPAQTTSQTFTMGNTTYTASSTYRDNADADIVVTSQDFIHHISFIFSSAPVAGVYDVVDYGTPEIGMQVKVLGLIDVPTTTYFANSSPGAVQVMLNNGKYSIIMKNVTASTTTQNATIAFTINLSASFSEK